MNPTNTQSAQSVPRLQVPVKVRAMYTYGQPGGEGTDGGDLPDGLYNEPGAYAPVDRGFSV